MSNTRNQKGTNPFYFNLTKEILDEYIILSGNSKPVQQKFASKASSMKTFMSRVDHHPFALHLTFDSHVKGIVFSDKSLGNSICTPDFFTPYTKAYSSTFQSSIVTAWSHIDTDSQTVCDMFSQYNSGLIRKAMFHLEIDTLVEHVVHRVRAFKTYYEGHCKMFGRPENEQAFIAKIAPIWEDEYLTKVALTDDRNLDLDIEAFSPIDEITAMVGDQPSAKKPKSSSKSAVAIKREQVSPAKSIVSVAKQQIVIPLLEQDLEEEVVEVKKPSKLGASNMSLLSMLGQFNAAPNLVLAKTIAKKSVVFGSLHDYFSPAVTLQMAHIFYAAKQLDLPTFSNLQASLLTCKTRIKALLETRDKQEADLQNKEIISYLLYVYSSSSNNVVPFPAQQLMGPFVSACNGFNSSMTTTCGYNQDTILLDSFVVDLMQQIDSGEVRYNCLFSVEPVKLAAGKAGDPQFIIGSSMMDKTNLKSQYSVLVREPFHTSMYDLLVRVRTFESLASKITAASTKFPLLMTESTYNTLKVLPQFKRFFEVLPSDFIKYYSARDYGKEVASDHPYKEYLKEQRSKDVENAGTVDFVLKYIKERKADFKLASTDPLITEYINAEEPTFKQKRQLLKGLKQLILVSSAQQSFKFITVESVSKFDQLLSPFNYNDTQQCIKDHLRYQGFNQIFSAYLHLGKQIYPFRLRARKDYDKSWTPHISNSKYKESANAYFKGDCVLARQTFFQLVQKQSLVLTNQNVNLLEHEAAKIPLKDAIPFVAPLLLAGPTETIACRLQLDLQSFKVEKLAELIPNIVIHSGDTEQDNQRQVDLANKVNNIFKSNPYLDKHQPIFSEDTGSFYELLGGQCTKSAASLIYGTTKWNSMLRLVPSLIERVEWFGQFVAFHATLQLKDNAKISDADQLKWHRETTGHDSLDTRVREIYAQYGAYLGENMCRPDIVHKSYVTIPDAKVLGKRTFEFIYKDCSYDEELDFETSFKLDDQLDEDENKAFKDFYRVKAVPQAPHAAVEGTDSEVESQLRVEDSEE